jgi:hypothetical protein
VTRPTRERAFPPTRAAVLAVLAALVLPLVLAARTDGYVYWTWNPSGPTGASGIGRANPDGSGVDQGFITGLGLTTGVAVDGAHIYWANFLDNAIGRASLDGTGVNPRFIDVPTGPYRVAVDAAYIYWTNGNGIGRANLDGSEVSQDFIERPAAAVSRLWGVAVDDAHIYWTLSEMEPPFPPAGSETIGCANLDGSGVNHRFITARADDVAVEGAHIYWSNNSSHAIGRADLDGSNVDESFIPCLPGAIGAPLGVAVDGAHVYWGNLGLGDPIPSNDTIGRANLDGTGVTQSFISAGGDPYDVAVDGALPGVPGSSSSCPPLPNGFSFGGLKRNLATGTAKLTVRVPGPGELLLKKTKRVGRDSDQAADAGKIRLKVRPRARAKEKLADRGKLKVRAHVTYTPTGGQPNTKSKKLKLKRR